MEICQPVSENDFVILSESSKKCYVVENKTSRLIDIDIKVIRNALAISVQFEIDKNGNMNSTNETSGSEEQGLGTPIEGEGGRSCGCACTEWYGTATGPQLDPAPVRATAGMLGSARFLRSPVNT